MIQYKLYKRVTHEALHLHEPREIRHRETGMPLWNWTGSVGEYHLSGKETKPCDLLENYKVECLLPRSSMHASVSYKNEISAQAHVSSSLQFFFFFFQKLSAVEQYKNNLHNSFFFCKIRVNSIVQRAMGHLAHSRVHETKKKNTIKFRNKMSPEENCFHAWM